MWLERHSGQWVPLIVRATTTGEVRAQLIDVGDIAYADLPAALVDGHGRLDQEYVKSREQLTQFLTGAINPRATHDRIVMVRTANLRNRGWGWLQDQHIAYDELLLPGADRADTASTPFKPGDLPGLRIVRLRERTTGGEVSRAFVSYMESVHTGTGADSKEVRPERGFRMGFAKRLCGRGAGKGVLRSMAKSTSVRRRARQTIAVTWVFAFAAFLIVVGAGFRLGQ